MHSNFVESSFTASDTVEGYLAPTDPHKSERIAPFAIVTFIVAIIALIIEIYLVRGVLNEAISLTFAIACHVIVSALCFIAAVFLRPFPTNQLFMMALALGTFAAGPFGAGGVITCCLLTLWYRQLSTPFTEWFQSIFPSLDLSHPEQVYDDIRTGRDEAPQVYEVESFMDVMRYGTDDQKRRALTKITTAFTPGFAPVLQTALADESNMIRVQAATALSIIENKFEERLIRLQQLHEARPNDPEVIIALANFYDDYSFANVLDHERELENQERARDLYEQHMRSHDSTLPILSRYGRLMLRMGDVNTATHTFEQALSIEPSANSISWLAECYFKQRRTDDLRGLARTVNDQYPEAWGDMLATVRESLEGWLPAGTRRVVTGTANDNRGPGTQVHSSTADGGSHG